MIQKPTHDAAVPPGHPAAGMYGGIDVAPEHGEQPGYIRGITSGSNQYYGPAAIEHQTTPHRPA